MSATLLAVFDVDGTLIDSREAIQTAMTRGFERAGLAPPPYEETRRIVGLSLRPALQTLAPGLNAEALERVAATYSAAWREMHADPAFHEPLYPGAADLLAHLAATGWRLAMATGKSRRGVETIVRTHGWEQVFASTHCADDGPGKPDPAMLLAALHAAHASPREAVMVGDTAFDMRMARAAGVRALGVTWGFHTEAEVSAGGADHIFSDFDDLRGEFDRFAASKRAVCEPI